MRHNTQAIIYNFIFKNLFHLILVIIYIGGYYISKYYSQNENQEQSFNLFLQSPLFFLSFSTFIFFYVIKYYENQKCTKNKLESKYILSQSIFYSILAVLSQYLYDFFLEKDCIAGLLTIFKKIDSITYIPKAFFIAGIVLLSNQLNYFICPKCETK